MVTNENLEASAPPQHFTRESLLTLLHLRQYIPLTAHQVTAFDQILSDNNHLLYEEWHFTQAEFDQRHPIDIALETERYKQLKQEVLSTPADKENQKKEYDFISHHAFLTAISLDSNIFEPEYQSTAEYLPKDYVDAINGRESTFWIPSIAEETRSLVEHDVFGVMLKSDLPADAKVLKSKWVFKKKSDGRYKTRFTAKGCGQRQGFDYDEVFSPVVRYTTLRSMCAAAAANDYHLHQMDIDTAFLYGKMDPDNDPAVYCQLPEDYPLPAHLANVDRKLLCGRLKSAIYGLKQASRKFFLTLQAYLTKPSMGFSASASDSCLFYKLVDGVPIWVAVFVDDLVISSPSMSVINSFKSDMRAKFNMKDLKELSTILGIEVIRDREAGTITLLQHRYMIEILTRFGMLDVKDRRQHKLPMDPTLKLSLSHCPTTQEERDKADEFPYREVVGSVMYLMCSTRPDIAYAVGQLSKFMNNWGAAHIKAAKDLLLYIKSTSERGITYHRGPLTLTVYSDSDWAGNPDNSRSTTGYIMYLAEGPISWRSKEQSTVATSTTEAEYMALCATSQETIHLRELLPFLHVDMTSPTTLYEDNSSAVLLANNAVHKDRTKHIKIKYHFIRECIFNKEIFVTRVESKQNVSDLLTKNVDNTTFSTLIARFLGTIPVQLMDI